MSDLKTLSVTRGPCCTDSSDTFVGGQKRAFYARQAWRTSGTVSGVAEGSQIDRPRQKNETNGFSQFRLRRCDSESGFGNLAQKIYLRVPEAECGVRFLLTRGRNRKCSARTSEVTSVVVYIFVSEVFQLPEVRRQLISKYFSPTKSMVLH